MEREGKFHWLLSSIQDSAETLSKFISKPKAELIAAHRPYEEVEQLLDLKGFNLKILENFGSKICAQNESSATSKDVKDKSTKDALLRTIKPKVSKTFYKSGVKSIVALSFNLYSVSYAHIDKDKKILEWLVLFNNTVKIFLKFSLALKSE